LINIRSNIKYKSVGGGFQQSFKFGGKGGSNAQSARETEAKAKQRVNELFVTYIQSGDFVRDAGELAKERIKRRTIQNRDYLGRPFKPYSKKYLEWKRSQGRYRNKVDLWLYGDMLNAIDFFPGVSPLRGRLMVRPHIQRHPKGGITRKSKARSLRRGMFNTKELAEIHHLGKEGAAIRPFFGWQTSSLEHMKLVQEMRRLVQQRQRRLGRMEHGVPWGRSGRSITTELT